ncbi:MAG: hypothetical protein JWM95_1409 [Gemmatimonadetes bacterium]|nr:hypothetical protein [Gemmatimonadota bacterium]
MRSRRAPPFASSCEWRCCRPEKELDNGGREALLRYLLDYDLSSIALNEIPRTLALAEQKISSLAPEQHRWLDTLHRASLPEDHLGAAEVETEVLYANYLAHLTRMGVTRKMSNTAFSEAPRRMVPGLYRKRLSITTSSGIRRPDGYEFPTLKECRRSFERLIGDDASWDEKAPDNWQEANSK